ncbi:hypothetical protein D9M69_587650 [compost metagenome]
MYTGKQLIDHLDLRAQSGHFTETKYLASNSIQTGRSNVKGCVRARSHHRHFACESLLMPTRNRCVYNQHARRFEAFGYFDGGARRHSYAQKKDCASNSACQCTFGAEEGILCLIRIHNENEYYIARPRLGCG